jgi:hypothetical protein
MSPLYNLEFYLPRARVQVLPSRTEVLPLHFFGRRESASELAGMAEHDLAALMVEVLVAPQASIRLGWDGGGRGPKSSDN